MAMSLSAHQEADDRTGTLVVMSTETRRILHWVVLVLSVLLTVLSIYYLASGERGFALWVGIVCWPFIGAASAYNLKTGRVGGQDSAA